VPAALDADALDRLFLGARTHCAWLDRPVDDALLERIHALARMGPTSANSCPMRVAFVRSREAKLRLMPALLESNRAQTMAAPVTAIIAHDTRFYEHLPRLYPHADARAWFAGPENAALAATTALRNGTLQGAYLMLAARALGLDCGPMSGFDNAAVDREFFPGGRIASNFLCNLGWGDASGLHPRGPRFEFAETCVIL
jgi:3-hydroxypropanoate dehydrogenase